MKNFKVALSSSSAFLDTHPDQLREIYNGLTTIKGSYQVPIGRITAQINEMIQSQGFTTDFNIEDSTNLTLGAIKGDLIFQAQLGNAARYYADLMKIEHTYRKGTARGAIYVCFSKEFIRNHYSTNLISFERATTEYKLFGAIITVPINFISIEL